MHNRWTEINWNLAIFFLLYSHMIKRSSYEMALNFLHHALISSTHTHIWGFIKSCKVQQLCQTEKIWSLWIHSAALSWMTIASAINEKKLLQKTNRSFVTIILFIKGFHYFFTPPTPQIFPPSFLQWSKGDKLQRQKQLSHLVSFFVL